MKNFVFAFLVLIPILYAARADKGDLVDLIAGILDSAKKNLPDDSDLKITNSSVSIPENDYENGTITINELSVSGLQSFEYSVSEDSSLQYAEYSVDFANLVVLIDVDVDINGTISYQESVYIRIALDSLGFQGNLTFTDTKYTELSQLDILLGLKASEFTIKGIVSDEYSEQLSEILSEYVPAIIDLLARSFEKQASDILRGLINMILT